MSVFIKVVSLFNFNKPLPTSLIKEFIDKFGAGETNFEIPRPQKITFVKVLNDVSVNVTAVAINLADYHKNYLLKYYGYRMVAFFDTLLCQFQTDKHCRDFLL